VTTILFLALSAPAPPHRPKPQPVPSGEYRMLWGGHAYRAAFAADGYCEFDNRWVGRWELAGQKLTVRERLWGDDREFVWSVELKPGTLSGVLDGGRQFSLTME
jgi:hypothetical protein